MKELSLTEKRVKHFNKQIKEKEGKIKFEKEFGTDRSDPTNYTSLLFEKEMEKNALFEDFSGLLRLSRVYDNGAQEIITQAQSFLHLLYYLAYYNDRRIKRLKLAEKQKLKEAKAKEKEEKAQMAYKEKSNQLDLWEWAAMLENQKKESLNNLNDEGKTAGEENHTGFTLEERQGVTFIKGTNFVISKIM